MQIPYTHPNNNAIKITQEVYLVDILNWLNQNNQIENFVTLLAENGLNEGYIDKVLEGLSKVV